MEMYVDTLHLCAQEGTYLYGHLVIFMVALLENISEHCSYYYHKCILGFKLQLEEIPGLHSG